MRFAWIMAAVVLSGCGASTQQELERTASNVQTFRYAENYQVVFRRISGSAKKCLAGDFLLAHGGEVVDAQLYGDLGFGEVSNYMSHALLPRHHFTARIEREGSGAQVTIRAEHANYVRSVDQWARGLADQRGCV